MGETRSGIGVAGSRRRWLLLLLVPLVAVPASAQNVVDLLVRQRRDARLAEIAADLGERAPPRPPAEILLAPPDPFVAAFLAVQADAAQRRQRLVAREATRADSLILAARLASLRWDKVEPGQQGGFLDQYREAYWRAGQPVRGLALDSLPTPRLRGYLQAAFGPPTRNADAQRRHGYGGSEYIQFEYWFVVNDSIPLLALDLDGPFGRGLLVATDEPHADLLPHLKRDLSDRLEAIRRPDPWVDYYHHFERRAWYRTGFNGMDYFTVEVRAPQWGGADSERWMIHR